MQLVFDGHNDVLLRLWRNAKMGSDPVAEFIDGTYEGHIDAPRAKAGGLAGGDFSWNLTMVLPDDPRVTVTCSRLLLGWACASAMPESASAQSATRLVAHPRRGAAHARESPMP